MQAKKRTLASGVASAPGGLRGADATPLVYLIQRRRRSARRLVEIEGGIGRFLRFVRVLGGHALAFLGGALNGVLVLTERLNALPACQVVDAEQQGQAAEHVAVLQQALASTKSL